VSGKGISAAILMANMQALLRTHVISTTSLPQVCERLNNHLFDFTEPARFTTCFLAQWFPDRKILEFVNAGHQVPVLDGFRQEPDFLKGGPPLGLFKGIEFDSGSVHLKQDDVLVLYSDGVTEAQNERDLEMGLERLREVITLNREFSPAEIQTRILERTRKWIGAEPHDDVTLMIVKVEDKKTESVSKAEVDGLRPISSSQ
jgi:sigma-B regulation protein RsbU (phosphoserine phosphatase)